ncbi:MAG: MipA/OmpV family protein [Gallionellaceae bacterium]
MFIVRLRAAARGNERFGVNGLLTFALSALSFATAQAQTDKKPLWEIGAGIGGVEFPVYRGSDERRPYLLPVPYFLYRGETIQIDREHLQGLLFRRKRVEMDVSVSGSVPANGAVARQGMPDLNPTLELGPALKTHLYYSENKLTNIDFRLPLRSVIASDFKSVQQVGWLCQPQLNIDFRDIERSGWNIGLMAGVIYADQRYHQFFYDVAPQYAMPNRPSYMAKGGYSGMQFIFAFNKSKNGRWVGGFVKWDDLSGATFVDSPLVKNRKYLSVGFAVTWVLDKSDKMVEVSND